MKMEYFKKIKIGEIEEKKKKIEKVTEEDMYNNILNIASYENSRRCLTWELIEYPGNLFIPDYVYEYIKNGFCLAGGAIIDLIENRKPKDYDLFIIPETNLGFLNDEYDYITSNAIGYGDIQIVKRKYDSPMQIIGGFDIDASRFIYYQNRILCTPSAFLSLKSKIIYINLYNQSKTLGYRLNKYCRLKKFVMKTIEPLSIKNMKSGRYDYGMALRSNRMIKSNSIELRDNFMFLMKEQYDRLYIKEKKFTVEDFKRLIKYIYKFEHEKKIFKSRGSGFPYNPRIFHGDNKIHFSYYKPGRHKFTIEGINYEIKYNPDMMKQLRINCLKLRYKYYDEVTNYKITNPTTQFTGSFYPIEYKYKIDFLKYLPEYYVPLYIYCKRRGLPRYIINMIMMFYCNYYIKKIIDN